MTAQRIGCRHARLAPRSCCSICGGLVSLLDVSVYQEAERFSSSTTAWRWLVRRDADGLPTSVGFQPPWWGGKAPA